MTLKSAIILTICVMIFGILIVSIYDLIIYLKFGSDATISRILLNTARKYPIFGVLFGISLGTLLGHLFWHQEIKVEEEKPRALLDQNSESALLDTAHNIQICCDCEGRGFLKCDNETCVETVVCYNCNAQGYIKIPIL